MSYLTVWWSDKIIVKSEHFIFFVSKVEKYKIGEENIREEPYCAVCFRPSFPLVDTSPPNRPP